jgi:AcrR family transcriptional regulator
MHGYTNTRLADITADIGMTTGALYRHFRGKEQLPAALLSDLAQAVPEAVSARSDRRGALQAFVETLAAHPGALRLMFERPSWPDTDEVEDAVTAAGLALRPHLRLPVSAERAKVLASFLSELLFHYARATREGAVEPRRPQDIASALDTMLDSGIYLAGTHVSEPRPTVQHEVRLTPFVQWQPSPEKVVPRSTKGIRTRQAIQEAAVRVFESRGLLDVTINDIAKEADVVAGSIYRYFVDKADIFRSMQAATEEAIIRETQLPLIDGRLALREQMLAYLSCYERHLGLIRAWRDLAKPGSDMAAAWNGMRSTFIRRIVAILKYGQAKGVAREDIDPVLVAQLNSLAYEAGAYACYVRADRSMQPQVISDLMYRLFIEGFADPASGRAPDRGADDASGGVEPEVRVLPVRSGRRRPPRPRAAGPRP